MFRGRIDSQEEIIPAAELSIIVSNLPQLRTFHTDLLVDFETRIERWDSDKKIADVLVKKAPFLGIYKQYLHNLETSTKVFENCLAEFPLFGKAVKEFQQDPMCKGLLLAGHFAAPFQRLCRYKMLLENYLKHQEKAGDMGDMEDTMKALEICAKAAADINNSMNNEEGIKLHQLQQKVGSFELIQPGRRLLKEGELLKFVRHEVAQPWYFILVTDALLCANYKVNTKYIFVTSL